VGHIKDSDVSCNNNFRDFDSSISSVPAREIDGQIDRRNRPETILIIDDDPLVRESLNSYLSMKGYHVIEFADGESFKDCVANIKANVAILDLNLTGIGGIELLPILKNDLDIPVIVYTGVDDARIAQKAIALGAYEFLAKPVNADFLLPVLRNAIENRKLKLENRLLRYSDKGRYGFANLIGISKTMQKIFSTIKQIAPSNATVLVRGSTGTGKDLVAEAIHRQSNRSDGPFVPLNCAALNPSLAESTLFGHEKGTFTGAIATYKGLLEQADGGTLFLDEIGSMPLELQAKLLRLLENKCFQRLGGTKEINVDVRFIAATNSDLEKAIQDGTFREDLYFRLNAITIELPELAKRRIDIPHLAMHFLRETKDELGRSFIGFTANAHRQMMEHDWPGNVRELRHSIEYAAALCNKEQIDKLPLNLAACCLRGALVSGKTLDSVESDSLAANVSLSSSDSFSVNDFIEGSHLLANGSITGNIPCYCEARESLLQCFDRKYFEKLLRYCHGNIKSASKISGMPYRTLHRKLKTLEISREDFLL